MRPVVSIANVEEWLGVTFSAASSLVAQMVDAGILIEVTGRRRDRRFGAREILEIFSPPDENLPGNG